MRPYQDRRAKGKGSMRRMIYLKVASLFLVMGFLVVVRVLAGSFIEFQKGDEALLEENYPSAIVHYERAIRYYLPFNPYVSMSIERIWNIIAEARERGDDWLAMEALRSLKGSLWATQHTVAHNTALIRKVEGEMKAFVSPPLPEGERRFPSDPLWSFLSLLGFFCWSGGTVALIFKAFGRANRRYLFIRALLAIVVLGYFFWIWGMFRA